MVENDIYNSKGRYESFLSRLDEITLTPEQKHQAGIKGSHKFKYHCLNPANLQYFRKLADKFEAKDLSYPRRNRLFMSLKLIVAATSKDLSQCEREDIDKVVSFMHSHYPAAKSKSDFIIDIKTMWRDLFPELDERGRVDDTIYPYAVRQLSPKIDKSKEKGRQDRLTPQEFMQILNYFSDQPNMRAFVALAMESLGRPQELLYLKIRDVETHDGYAKIYLNEHGKEGAGLLQSFDSFVYLAAWMNIHPYKNNPDAYLFVNILTKNGLHDQLTPFTTNKKLRQACKELGIRKPVTNYSLKRNGVTFRRLNGETDLEIQHAARWTSSKQLRVYDKSNQEDAFLAKGRRTGKIKGQQQEQRVVVMIRICPECKTENPTGNNHCSKCHRPLTKEAILDREKREQMVEINHTILLMLLKVLNEEQDRAFFQLVKEGGYEDKLRALLQSGASPST